VFSCFTIFQPLSDQADADEEDEADGGQFHDRADDQCNITNTPMPYVIGVANGHPRPTADRAISNASIFDRRSDRGMRLQ
jgi:hypothetical protein